MRKISFVFAILSFFAISTCYGQGDSCIVIWPGTAVDKADTSILVYNPDSTYVDTCGSSATYLGRYCRRAYRVDFDRYVIHSPVFSFDTALVYEWTAIDTAFSDIRNGFEALEGEVGNFTLTKLAAYIDDTSSELNRAFIMRFDSLLNVDSVLSQLLSIPGVNNARWYGMPHFHNNVNTVSFESNIAIWPQPAKDKVFFQGVDHFDVIHIYNSLGSKVTLPFNHVSDRLINFDVSEQPDGVLYFFLLDQFIKVLIKK